MAHLKCDPRLHPSACPTSVDYRDTSFFQTPTIGSQPPQLPDPSTVLEKLPGVTSGVVTFKDLSLVVKFGTPSELTVDEAQAIRAVGGTFSMDQVPVPELFGWRTQSGKSFIYRGLISGEQLRDSWKDLTRHEKRFISFQLGQIFAALRALSLSQSSIFIGLQFISCVPNVK
jgi:hypothetical protein